MIKAIVNTPDFHFSKINHIYFSNIEFTKDENIFINKKEVETSIMLDYYDFTYTYFKNRTENELHYLQKVEEERLRAEEEGEEPRTIENPYEVIGRFEVMASPKIIQIERSYQKFLAWIAEVTQILEEIMVLIVLFVSAVESQMIKHKLIETMMKYRGGKYYNVEYYVSKFNENKISNNLKEFLRGETLKLSRKELANAPTLKAKEKCIEENKTNLENIKETKKEEENPEGLKVILEENKGKQNQDTALATPNAFIRSDTVRTSLRRRHTFKNTGKLNDIHLGEVPNSSGRDIMPKREKTKTDQAKSMKSMIQPITETNQNEYNETENDLNKSKKVRKLKRNESSFLKDDNTYVINYSKLNICDIITAHLCFCWTIKMKLRKEILQNAESKINYYMDVYNYIRKIQEVDLLKYCVLDDNQMELFSHLSRPPIKMGFGNEGIYEYFSQQQKTPNKITRRQIDELIDAYNLIQKKPEYDFEDVKLLRLINAEVDFLCS
ncbi:MAG: hypothetical protein MJ252_22695 [archaeon]|nr:hypothetical protein [archaeon]